MEKIFNELISCLISQALNHPLHENPYLGYFGNGARQGGYTNSTGTIGSGLFHIHKRKHIKVNASHNI